MMYDEREEGAALDPAVKGLMEDTDGGEDEEEEENETPSGGADSEEEYE